MGNVPYICAYVKQPFNIVCFVIKSIYISIKQETYLSSNTQNNVRERVYISIVFLGKGITPS